MPTGKGITDAHAGEGAMNEGAVFVSQGSATSIIKWQSARRPHISEALKANGFGPTSPAPGVQLKTELTGFPMVGNAGVMIAVPGKPAELMVTMSPASASEALTVNDTGIPMVAGNVVPHAGVGAINSGRIFASQGSPATLI